MNLGRHGWVAAAALLLILPLLWQESRAVDQTSVVQTAVSHVSHPSGHYQQDVVLHLQVPSSQAEILYTLNGRLPTPENSLNYTQPIPLTTVPPKAVSLRTRLRWPDGTLGSVQTHSYFLGLPDSIPLLALTLDPDDFSTLHTNFTQRGRDWERDVVVTYHDSAVQNGFSVPAGLRIHGRISRNEAKKSFRLYFRSEYGQAQLNYPLFPCPKAPCPTTFDRLVIHNGGQDSPTLPHVLARVNWTLLRNQLAARLVQEMGTLTASRSQPVLLFINGEPWGIYVLRERIDDVFLSEQLGIESADMLDTPERIVGTDQIDLGDRQHWDNLLTYIESHDLSDPSAYRYVQTQVNIENFIDYNLFQIFVANDDWPMHNVRQFRSRGAGGRWHWIIWDIDRGFAFTPPSSIDKNMFLRAEEQTHELTSDKHTLLYRRLLANDAFRQQYLARLAELLDSTFHPDSLTRHLDEIVAEIEPVIDYEIGRWQPDRTAWVSNVADLYAFAQQRAAIVREQAIGHFGEEETAVLR